MLFMKNIDALDVASFMTLIISLRYSFLLTQKPTSVCLHAFVEVICGESVSFRFLAQETSTNSH